MSLSSRQKSALYRELGQLLRSGKPFPASVQLLIGSTHGAVKNLLVLLKAATDKGAPVGDAFAAQYPQISHLESSIISAGARSGKLDQCCLFLSGYYQQLWEARKSVLRKMLYPAFILHFAIFVTGLPSLAFHYNSGMGNAAVTAYLKESLGTLILIYLFGLAFWVLCLLLNKQGARQPGVDRFLRMIPFLGKLRRAFALARFCATYEMQLQSGVNVMDSLASAGKASQSGLVNAEVRRAVPLVRGGAQVAPLLQGSDAFTREMVRAIQIGEETGTLDTELKRLGDDFQQEARVRLEFFSAFLFKGLYFAVCIYVGVRIVFGYMGYINGILSLGQ